MAYSMDTAELQRISQEMFELYIYDLKLLRIDCPLDHGRHKLNDVKHDLGTLMKLPLELQYDVLDKLDVKSLLVFRRASKAAMTTVNNMVSYQKVRAARCRSAKNQTQEGNKDHNRTFPDMCRVFKKSHHHDKQQTYSDTLWHQRCIW